MNREDFEILNEYVYLDSAATSLKPKQILKPIQEYYLNHTSNIHRGDYDLSIETEKKYDETRNLVSEFINAKPNEIAFTNNATDSLNKIVFGYFKNKLTKDDEVLITLSEHASNVLPWFELDVKVKYMSLDENHSLTLENVKKQVTNNTKVISIAHVTNVIGDTRPIKEIIKYAHANNIKVVIDGAQSVPHMKIDVKDLDIDFLAFSAHKMCGPTGLGILYVNEKYTNEIRPIIFGGGMNATFSSNKEREFDLFPRSMEAGTPNIEAVIAFGETIKYLNSIGMENINNYVNDLRKYAIQELKNIENIIIYNEYSDSGLITFNMYDVFAQDLAIYLNKHKICIRAGNHCAKLLKEELNVKNTCRISLYFYNNRNDIDKLVEALKNKNIKEEII